MENKKQIITVTKIEQDIKSKDLSCTSTLYETSFDCNFYDVIIGCAAILIDAEAELKTDNDKEKFRSDFLHTLNNMRNGKVDCKRL